MKYFSNKRFLSKNIFQFLKGILGEFKGQIRNCLLLRVLYVTKFIQNIFGYFLPLKKGFVGFAAPWTKKYFFHRFWSFFSIFELSILNNILKIKEKKKGKIN